MVNNIENLCIIFLEMTEAEITLFQKIKSNIVPIVFNIALPIWDVFSDGRIIILLLFIGGQKCRNWDDDYRTCEDDPTSYCTSNSALPWLCEETYGGYRCRWWYDDYDTCRDDPTSYCTSNPTIPGMCEDVTHLWFGLMMLVPFIINYLVSIYIWIRRDDTKKFTFMFPLLNLYAPYGMVRGC